MPKAIRRGWCLGEPAFKQELLEQMADGFGGNHGGSERAESAAAGVERWVGAELQRLGWDGAESKRRRKGDPGTVRLARRLRRETTMTLAGIATRPVMGSASMVTHCLRKRTR